MNALNEKLQAQGFRKKKSADDDGGCFVCDFRSLIDPDADDSDDYCAYFHMRFKDDDYICQQYKINRNIAGLAESLTSSGKPVSQEKGKKKTLFQRLFGKN